MIRLRVGTLSIPFQMSLKVSLSLFIIRTLLHKSLRVTAWSLVLKPEIFRSRIQHHSIASYHSGYKIISGIYIVKTPRYLLCFIYLKEKRSNSQIAKSFLRSKNRNTSSSGTLHALITVCLWAVNLVIALRTAIYATKFPVMLILMLAWLLRSMRS